MQLRFEWFKEKCVKQILFVLIFGSFCPRLAEHNWKFVGTQACGLLVNLKIFKKPGLHNYY